MDLNRLYRLASRCGINVTRGAAMLPPSYADRIRSGAREEAERRTRAASRTAPRPLPRSPSGGAEGRCPESAPDGSAQCECCGRRLPSYGPGEDPGPLPQFCAGCVAHYPAQGESDERRGGRLDEEHDERARATYPVLERQIAKARERAAQQSSSRDKWRAALVEVMAAHDEGPTGGCRCGAKVYPCLTWKTLERANRGVTRQVEDFLAMPDDERDVALYGDGPA